MEVTGMIMINTNGMTFLPAFMKFRLLIGQTQQKGGAGTNDFLCRMSHIVDTEEQLHNPSTLVWELR
jgi:hypothetical protein